MKKYLLLPVIIVAIVLVVLYRERIFTSGPKASPAPTDEGVSFDGFPNQDLTQQSVPRERLTGPGSCSLSGGKIVFLDKNTARNDDAFLSYKNIDSPARLITWHVSPDDGSLRIGPNIISGLPIPEGKTNLTVNFNSDPKEDKYKLTAEVGYGEVNAEGIIIGTKNAKCSGSITVQI